MPEENYGQTTAWKPDPKAPANTPVQSSGNKDIRPAAENNHSEGNEGETAKLAREIKSGEKWLIGIGIATLLINSGIALIYWGQLKEMRKATGESAIAASAATNAATAADNTLIQSRTQFQRDQRPYVAMPSKSTQAPGFFDNPNNPGMGQITWDWHMANYGKTPAYGLTFKEQIKVGNGRFYPSYTTGPKNYNSSGGILLPTDDAFHTVISAPTNRAEFTKAMGIDNGISIRMIVKYRDSYGTTYETGICLSHLKLGSVLLCEGNYIK